MAKKTNHGPHRPNGIIVTLKGKRRALRGVKVIGPVTVEKITGNGRHTQVEIRGVEIDGYDRVDSARPE